MTYNFKEGDKTHFNNKGGFPKNAAVSVGLPEKEVC